MGLSKIAVLRMKYIITINVTVDAAHLEFFNEKRKKGRTTKKASHALRL